MQEARKNNEKNKSEQFSENSSTTEPINRSEKLANIADVGTVMAVCMEYLLLVGWDEGI